jgi:nickel/cobalt transporter (NiCoT) family protein
MAIRVRTFPRCWWGAASTVLLLNTVGFLLASTHTPLLALAATAWLLGARHAFDPDHIAAIDTATRNLSATRDKRRNASSAGFWFALGHSTLVMVAAAATCAGAGAVTSRLADGGNLAGTISLLGTLLAAALLLGLGAYNLDAARRLSTRSTADAAAPGGLLTRLLPRFMNAATSAPRLWILGVAFGLGFDTATEVSLLVLAATSTLYGVPLAALALPLLFCGGMTLFDLADSTVLAHAYQWATATVRRRFILTVTTASGLMAVTIGTLQAWSLAADLWRLPTPVDLPWLGYSATGGLLALWAFTALRRQARQRTPVSSSALDMV